MSQRRSRLIFHAGNLDTRECAAKDGFLLASWRTCCWRSAFSWCSGEDRFEEHLTMIDIGLHSHTFRRSVGMRNAGFVKTTDPDPSLKLSPSSVTIISCDSIRQQNVWWIEIHLRGLLLDLNIESFFTATPPSAVEIFSKGNYYSGHGSRSPLGGVHSPVGNFIRSPSHIYYRPAEKKVKKRIQSRHFSIFSIKSETGNWAKWTNWWKRARNSRPKAGATHKCR